MSEFVSHSGVDTQYYIDIKVKSKKTDKQYTE